MRVGGGLIKGFNTVQHNSPMLSLSNTYSKEARELILSMNNKRRVLSTDRRKKEDDLEKASAVTDAQLAKDTKAAEI